MKNPSHTEQRVAQILERMQKAMPEIKRQIEVYEKSIQFDHIKTPKVTVHSRNV